MVKITTKWFTRMTAARFPFLEFEQLPQVIGKEDDSSLFNDMLPIKNKELKPETLKEIFYTQKDIEEAKKQGYEEGEQQGIAKQKSMEEEFKAMILNTLNSIIEKVNEISSNISSNQDELMEGCAELAFSIAAKVAGNAEKQINKEIILNFLKDNFKFFIDEPSVSIKLNPETYLLIKEEIEKAYSGHKFKGNLMISIDYNMERGDCAVEFRNTSIKKTKNEINKAIEAIFSKYMAKDKEQEIETTSITEE